MKTKVLLLLSVTFLLSSCIDDATKYFTQGKAEFEHQEYEDAIQHLKTAAEKGAPQGESAFYIAEGYRRSNRMEEAEKYYKIALDEGYEDDHVDFYYGYAMKANGKYESAKIQFQKFIKVGGDDEYVSLAKNEIKNIEELNKIWSKKAKYKVVNVEALNTDGIEYSPMMLFEELYFTSSRGDGVTFSGHGTRFTDLYSYRFDGGEKFSGQVYPINDVVNQEATHEATTTFSADGRTMIFSRGNNGKNNDITQEVDLFQSYYEQGHWTTPERLDISETFSWDSNPALSTTGDTLYFSSNREDGLGGDDIWYAVSINGEWSMPQNLGAPINTAGDEQFPYVAKNGKFYFSSDGHPGFGGLDLFEVRVKSNDTLIENMARPVNSRSDDFSICFKNDKEGFFASNREGGQGDDDIYAFTYDCDIHYEMQVQILSEELDPVSHQPTGKQKPLIGASVDVLRGNSKILTVKSNDSGYVIFPTDPGVEYRFKVTANGYLTQNIKCSAPNKVKEEDVDDCSKAITSQVCTAVLTPILENLEIEFAPILYKYNKWDILPASEVILIQMVKVMKDNPSILVELGSHTDARGSIRYNDILSQKRAESAVNWIIKVGGIDASRITAKGYGERVPRVLKRTEGIFKDGTKMTEELITQYEKTDTTSFELGHQLNRRTEFRVVGTIDEPVDASNIKVVDDGSRTSEKADANKIPHEDDIIKKHLGDDADKSNVDYEKGEGWQMDTTKVQVK